MSIALLRSLLLQIQNNIKEVVAARHEDGFVPLVLATASLLANDEGAISVAVYQKSGASSVSTVYNFYSYDDLSDLVENNLDSAAKACADNYFRNQNTIGRG